MPTSRFLKKRRRETIEDVSPGFSSSLEGKRLTTNLETRSIIGADRTLYESCQKQWKSKDDDFAKSIKKRLNDLTNTLSPSSSSSSSSSFVASASSSPSRFRSRTTPGLRQQHHQHLSLGDSVVGPPPPREWIARETHVVPSVHLERPRPTASLDRWYGESRHGRAGGDREVHSFLLDRKLSKEPRPEDDESHLVRSMWEIVRSLGSGGHDRPPAEYYYWHRGPGGTRRELAEFSRVIGPLLSSSADTEYRLDGRNFWSRLAACRGEFLRTENLVNSVFDRGQGFGYYHFVYPCRRETTWTALPAASSLSDGRTFYPAEEAIRWAHHHRLKILDY